MKDYSLGLDPIYKIYSHTAGFGILEVVNPHLLNNLHNYIN